MITMIKKTLLLKFEEVYNPEKPNIEAALVALRNAGATQMDCLKIIKQKLNLSIKEADEIILNSKTWSSHFDSNISIRESFANFLEEKNDVIDDRST